MKKMILILSLILIPGGALADCTADETTFNSTVDQIRNAPAGSDTNSMVATARQQATTVASHCNFTGNNVPQVGTQNDKAMEANQTPASPGETSLPVDPTFFKSMLTSITGAVSASTMPKTKPVTYTPTVPSTPYKDAATNSTTAANGSTTASNSSTTSTCGTTAAAYASYASSLTGSNQLTYKQGCAGTNINGGASASSDYPLTSCTSKQIGSFGLVQAAYNNRQQVVSTGSITSLTPASSNSTNTLSSYDKNTGTRNDPGGCSLTNYSVCGQAGDIIMVQTAANATDTGYYDTYLIYDGQGGFYYAQPNGTPAIMHGALPVQYANDSYAATRPSCPSASGQ